MGSSVFVIDSSPAVHRMVEKLSTPDGHRIVVFHDGPSALDAARSHSPALIIADYHLENITFSGFCKAIGRQENLAETVIVSMVDAADRLDENKLRSLGVRAFLKKPFEREQLLDTINTILTGTAGRPGATPAKARTWPPVSTGTDDEEDQEPPHNAASDATPRQAGEKERATMSPSPTHPLSASTPSSSRSEGEELLKDLVDYLLHSTTAQADKTLVSLLPTSIAKEVASQLGNALGNAVQTEVSKQIAEALAPERLQTSLRAMIQEELDRQAETQRVGVNATIRQAVIDIAPPFLAQAADQRLGELMDSGIQQHLPNALQAHLNLDLMTQLVKKEVEQVAANCARQAADEIVREMAKDPIQQAVRRIVPDVAETQIRAEITRLSSPG